jgi:peptidoglycan hydrolase CwlO-like protein
MARKLFASFILLVAVAPWTLLLLEPVDHGKTETLEFENARLQLQSETDRQAMMRYEERISELSKELGDAHSRVLFYDELLSKTEKKIQDGGKEKQGVESQMRQLRLELAEVEQRLLDETNRANLLESINEDIAVRLDATLQEVKRLQAIIRTLSGE